MPDDNKSPETENNRKEWEDFFKTTYFSPFKITFDDVEMYKNLTAAASRTFNKDPKTISANEVLQILTQNVKPAYYNSLEFYKVSIYIVWSVVLVSILFIGTAVLLGKEVNPGLIAIASAGIGVFTGIFSANK